MPRQHTDRTQLQQIIVGLTEGVIIINPDQTIALANAAALAMHGIGLVKELGNTVSDYRALFELRYRNRHKVAPNDYPMDRGMSAEAFAAVVVEVARPGEDRHWVHHIRSLVLTDIAGQPDCLVLVLQDQTEEAEREIASLSPRDRQVLALVAQGLSDNEIAGKLSVTRHTIRNHVSAIYTKLGVHRRSAVVVWARERGLGVGPNALTKPDKPRRRRRG